MEIIDLSKPNIDESLRHAIIEIMVGKIESPNVEEMWKKCRHDDPNYLKFEVEMKIDGIEVNFSTFLKLLLEQFDNEVKKAAIRYVQDSKNIFSNKMDNLIEEMKYDLGLQGNSEY